MGATTKIQWSRYTWSPWRGCVHATMPDGTEHPGCANCYAETMSKRNPSVLGSWGPDGTRVVAAEKSWEQVRRWNAAAAKAGTRERIFPSLCDPFEEWANVMRGVGGGYLHLSAKWFRNDGLYCEHPEIVIGRSRITMADVRGRLFDLIDDTPNLDWLLLTKRPQNVRRMWPNPPPMNRRVEPLDLHRHNVHLLYSASDQPSFEAGIGDLVSCRDHVPTLGISAEPLLGPLDMTGYLWPDAAPCCRFCDEVECDHRCIDWVIVGGESGPHARPCDIEWILSIVRQCKAAGVPCYVKQLGSQAVQFDDGGIAGREAIVPYLTTDRKGGDPAEWPEDLRVREYPESMR